MTSEVSSINESDEPLPEQPRAPEIIRVDKERLIRLLGEISLAEKALREASVRPGMIEAARRAEALSRARKALESSISSETMLNEDTEELIRSVDSLVAR